MVRERRIVVDCQSRPRRFGERLARGHGDAHKIQEQRLEKRGDRRKRQQYRRRLRRRKHERRRRIKKKNQTLRQGEIHFAERKNRFSVVLHKQSDSLFRLRQMAELLYRTAARRYHVRRRYAVERRNFLREARGKFTAGYVQNQVRVYLLRADELRGNLYGFRRRGN